MEYFPNLPGAWLETVGISRVQLTELVPGSIDALAPYVGKTGNP